MESEMEQAIELVVPQVGSIWEGQGGFYAGIMRGANGAANYHLIVGTEDGERLEWGAYGKKIEGADSKLDGLANTKALLASKHSHPAAKWTSEYTRDGHTDFYLPAQRELNLAYATLAEEFSPNWYWSSTQFSAYDAWYQDFGDGAQDASSKDFDYRVRAFRSINILAIQ
jgi:hypothetical protein